MGPITELLLFSAARAELVNNFLRPALQEERVVVCDRFTPSTVAYQGYARGIPLETIEQLNRLTTADLEATVIILLDLPPEDGLLRVPAQASLAPETEGSSTTYRRDEEGSRRFEEEPLAFHQKVRRGYLEQAKADPERWLIVDGNLPKERIADIVWQRVEPLIRSRDR